jgi:hypothetical protein
MGQAPWTARRKPAGEVAQTAAQSAPARTNTAGTPDVSGKWDIAVRMAQGEFPMSVTLAQTGESVSGSLAGPMGLMPLTGTMVGKNLTLEFKTATPQGDLAVTLTGELGADGLKGKLALPGLGEAEWVGKRVQ